MQLRPGELPLLRQMVLQLAGVALDESKGYLIENRLGSIAQAAGCANFNELYFKIRYGNDAPLVQKVVDAITTHETTWFRDGAPYEALQFKVIPEVIDHRTKAGTPKKLRIWSAACSSGQEPYSIAMVLSEMLPDIASWDIQILGTDIAKGTLESAERGVYSELEIQRTAKPALTPKYFDKQKDGYRIKDSVRRLCRFQQLNLMDPIATLGPFDVVFLRNVLIYFEKQAKVEILRRVRNVLLPYGWLFVGATESLADVDNTLVPQVHCRATVFQSKVTAPGLSALTGGRR